MGKPGTMVKVGPLARRATKVTRAGRVELGQDEFGQVCVVDAEEEVTREVVELTPEGRQAVHEFLSAYDYSPIRMMKVRPHPGKPKNYGLLWVQGLYEKLLKCGWTDEEVNDAMIEAAVLTGVKFDPGMEFKFSTYFLKVVVSVFNRALAKAARQYQAGRLIPIDAGEDGSTVGLIDSRGESVDDRDERTSAAVVVGSLLDKLSNKEREVISLRYGIGGGGPLSLGQIAIRYGVSKERIRQVQAAGLAKLGKGQVKEGVA